MKSSINNLLEFTKFTHKFQKVLRTLYVTGEERDENDLEHSGQLALIAWYVIDSEKLKLDIEKVLKYALTHDLVETYAGDTFLYTKDKSFKDSKIERERKALEKIKKEFPKNKEMYKTIEGYEKRKDKESKFVYVLDKILPVLNIYLDGGRSWKREKVTLEMIRKHKDNKILLSPELINLWKEFTTLLEKTKTKLIQK